jgi:short-subunit dehydrogenase
VTLPWRTALVTGASSGIGRRLAVKLAAGGVRVILAARRERELREAADEAGALAEPLALDVGDTDETVRVVRELDARLGGLDLVVANAGVGVADRAAPPWSWEAIGPACRVNFTGAAATLTAALPGMVARGRGHLVGVSSLASFGALPEAAAYCAPKAGLSMLLDCLRMDLATSGVAVTCVNLGFVETRMVAESTHRMPQLLTASEAVDRVLARLPGAPAVIDVPQPLALATRLFARLPRRLRHLVLRKL